MVAEISIFEGFPGEILGLILTRLPVTDLRSAGRVCKDWCAVVRTRPFTQFYDKASVRKPWLFQYCVNYLCPGKNQGYGYDPETKQWNLISSQYFPSDRRNAFAGSPDGWLFTITNLTHVCYKRELLQSHWAQAPAMHYSRNINSPLFGVVEDRSCNSHKLIVAGGVAFFEEDHHAVEIYDPSVGEWELCQSMPIEFEGNCSRHWMTSASVGGKFYIAEKYSGAYAVLDLELRVWSAVRTLQPPGVVHSHLLSVEGRLLLAGSCYFGDKGRFKIWEVNEETMEYGAVVASMPADLCNFFVPGEDGEERKDGGLQCVAYRQLIYVFLPVYSREQSRDNQVVVCDLSLRSPSWTLLPPLPESASYNHVVTFTSVVKLESLSCSSLLKLEYLPFMLKSLVS